MMLFDEMGKYRMSSKTCLKTFSCCDGVAENGLLIPGGRVFGFVHMAGGSGSAQ